METSTDLIKISDHLKNGKRKTIFKKAEPAIEKILALDEINTIYKSDFKYRSNKALFVDELLEKLNITYTLDYDTLNRIPKDEPIILIANHPFGTIDGIILSAILEKVRPDFKIMANSLLKQASEIEENFIFVNPFNENNKENMKPLKESIKWIKDGHALALFPAGEVAHFKPTKGEIIDPEWNNIVSKLVKKTGASVVPIHFSGTNSLLFQSLGLIHPILRTIMIPRELLNKSETEINVSIGHKVNSSVINAFEKHKEKTAFLRFLTYLNKPIDEQSSQFTESDPKEIIPPTPKVLMESDIEKLPSSQNIHSYKDFKVYYATQKQIPFVMTEISRLREVTYREVGEGTNLSYDKDKYDAWYTHLFIWNTKTSEVVGAYRMGNIKEIYDEHGTDGIYTNELFKYNEKKLAKTPNSLELGRSFIRKEYQRKHYSLLLLWKGICSYIALHPEIKTLFGPVSISADYSIKSRALMSSFLKSKNGIVKARNPLKYKFKGELKRYIKTTQTKSMSDLSTFVKHIESDQKDIPVLLKQYLKLGGKLVAFNVDKSFNNCLDGFIQVDVPKIPQKTLELYMGEASKDYLEFHK